MPDAPPALQELKLRLQKIQDLDRAQAVLEWDLRTMMPARGASARIEALASIERARHERFASDEIGDLLSEVTDFANALPPDHDDAALIRVARQEYEKAVLVPAGLRGQITRAAAIAEHSWDEARKRSDFNLLLPHLEEIVELKRRYIECFDTAHPYDALLHDFEPGMTTPEIQRIINDLRDELVPLAAEIAHSSVKIDDSAFRGSFPVGRQRDFVLSLLRVLPLERDTWRLDSTVHPFATAFSTTDVRLTTRYSGNDLAMGLFSALHELGHGLYEAGVDPVFERTQLGKPTSLGLHESQSRMWENMVGRSRAFWRWAQPRIRAAFPDQLAGVDAEHLYRAANKVQPSLIRIEADQVTYDLHIALRFELELAIFNGDLELRDLPDAWNERVRSYLDLDVPRDADGVLQDVHWAEGSFGYFPTYSLGNVVSGQLWEAANAALPDLDGQIATGDLRPLRDWLREHVHRHGQKFTAAQIIERTTGGPIDVAPYVRYLRKKFGEIYELPRREVAV